jgi:hypothetical protein
MPAERTIMRQVREVLRLKFVGGVPTREIAQGLGTSGLSCISPLRAGISGSLRAGADAKGPPGSFGKPGPRGLLPDRSRWGRSQPSFATMPKSKRP